MSKVCAIAADTLVPVVSWYYSFEYHNRTGLGLFRRATGASLTKVCLRDVTAHKLSGSVVSGSLHHCRDDLLRVRNVSLAILPLYQ